MRFIFEKFLQVKKRSLFLLGVLATGLLGSIGGYLRVHISKEDDSDSLLASTAHALMSRSGAGNRTTVGGRVVVGAAQILLAVDCFQL